jgi:L-fuconolactonase
MAEIVDAQVHIWAANTPERPWPARHEAHKPQPITAEDMIREMKAAGVDKCVLVPPSWEGERNDVCLAAAKKYPDKFAVMGRLDPDAQSSRDQIAGWRKQPGMLGLRFTLHRPFLRPLLTEGRLDWIWPAAEKAGVPVMTLAQAPDLHLFGEVAGRHPGLKMTIDHMGLTGGKGEEAFAGQGELLALAKRPNIAVKVTCLPHYATDPYPFRSLHPHLRKVYDAFGPKRMFWGSDISRLPCTYRESLTYMMDEVPWLSASDKEWIGGRGVMEWVGWQSQPKG